MRHATLETGGRDSAKAGEGGWASWTAQALFAWTRTHDEPGKSGTFGYIAAGLLCADVSFTLRALVRFWAVGAKASHGNNRLLDACFRVFARCAKKKIFNSFTSFSRWKWFISLSLSSFPFSFPLLFLSISLSLRPFFCAKKCTLRIYPINLLSAKPSFQLWYPGGQHLKVISFS